MLETDIAEQAAWNKICAAGRERLKKRLAEHKVTAIPGPPSFDNVLVLRLPLKERKTEGGIILNATTKFGDWEAEPESEGILVAAGLQALDSFRSHDIVIGDHVEIGRFAGWEREAKLDASGNKTARMLKLKAADVNKSFDHGERLEAGLIELAWDPEAREHYFRIVT